ncbi:MAG: response regulator [bacterium]|nr:response regulator [bacterium]
MATDREIHILIVDDSAPMRHLVRQTLEELYFKNFFEAENGEEALKVLESQGIDLVLLDWQMPKMTGISLLREIRSQDKYKTLPVVMITSEATKDNIIEAAKEGVTGYILKPFDSFLLGEKIEKVLSDN